MKAGYVSKQQPISIATLELLELDELDELEELLDELELLLLDEELEELLDDELLELDDEDEELLELETTQQQGIPAINYEQADPSPPYAPSINSQIASVVWKQTTPAVDSV